MADEGVSWLGVLWRAGVLSWGALAVLGLVLGIGMSWSLVRRRITGQVDVDSVDR